ncbi:amidohydrolase family protein [Mucilaginibacter achroorhodeus]|uniref:Amidohydrolase family protein n=1 Tax=Mucilaginibacter achroorhodeus TaxID=2599294 RepID=A0A563TZ87_9SPHI|nr:amidohydrolase family protein [Mucilaginibacter achroorhodeus]TWR24684.1 amidohydrolase family protein [Mucilaginibacter achroorhodeus]
MRKLLFLIFLSCIVCQTYAQEIPADSGVFLLHKFQQNIGKETYKFYNYRDQKKYVVDFKFVDRGSPVPLKATIKVNPVGDPIELRIKGNTSRFSTVNDSIAIKGNSALVQVNGSSQTKNIAPNTFPIAGYSPATVQQLLLQYWNKQKQPANITTLPFGALQIRKDGTDNLSFNSKQLAFNRYLISGLIWGNELVWTDANGKLICILTIDAEGDKTEMMRQEYESLLPEFINRAAGYGMAAFAKAAPPQKATSSIVAIKGGNIIDVENGRSVPNDILLLRNGVIASMGKGTAIPKGATVIDATGKTIMPGLWDMHAHFEQTEWGPAYLAAGVTTVRDCGNELGFIDAVRNAIDAGKGIGPKILMAGIIDGKGPMALGIIQADTKEEAVKAVDTYKAKGFDQIKIYSSIKPAILKVICDEAHKQGFTVTGHIPNGMTLKGGVDSGMNMVNHIQYVYSLMKRNKDRSINFDDSVSKATIKFIKDHKTVIDPTIGVYDLALRDVKGDITKMEPAFYTLPLPLQTQFANTGEDSATHAMLMPMLSSMKVLVKKLYDDGVPVVAGTDMGFPGFSVARELELYVEGGLTPAQALKTATLIPAQVMGLEQKTGSISTGKNADILIIHGNPLNNISAVRNVKVVIKGGKVYNPYVLHKMVGFSK